MIARWSIAARFCVAMGTVILLCVLCSAGYAQNLPAPQIRAKAWILFDAASGQTLAQGQAEQGLPLASLTKVMTAYVVFTALKQGKIKLLQTLRPSAHAVQASGASMHLAAAQDVSVEDLLQGMILLSANDASVALAETVGGSEAGFVLMMNQEAQRLGLENTQFRSATGESIVGHYSSARDLARLAASLIREFPEYYSLFGLHEFTYHGLRQENRNRLLWLDTTVDGIKTGQTEAAGWCLLASAVRGPRRLISVVLGAASEEDRFQESLRLLNYGFQAFETIKIQTAYRSLKTVPVWQGTATQVNIGLRQDAVLSVPINRAPGLSQKLRYQEALRAPLMVGDPAGSLIVSLDGEKIGEYPVYALQDIRQAGWFGRLWDSLRYWLNHL